MRFPLVAAIAILTAAGPAAAQAPLAPAAPLVHTPSSIRVDVVVTDRLNRPIRDLTPADFTVSDAGQGRPVDAVALRSGSDGRVVAIFLDEYHVAPGDSTERARAALTGFIETALRPNDLVAILKPLDPLNSVQLLNVARDRARLQAQIDGFTGRQGDYTPATAFERNFMSSAPAQAEVNRSQIVSSALQSLALHIGAARDGRKAVVLISEGFSPSLPRGSDRLMGSLRAIVYAANRYEVAIYPVDPRAPGSGDAEPDAATLQMLADQTGGKAAFGRADLLPALAQATADLDDYYMLTYTAADSGDGRFHPVQLSVKRADAQLRVRSGYWSASADLLRSTEATVARASAMPVKPAHASLLIRPWIGTARGSDGQTDVTVAWEPGLTPPRNQHVASVTLKATSDDGRVLFDAPLAPRTTFSAPPGLVHLDMTILGIDGRKLDSDYRGIQVPNLHVTRLTFASLQVMRTRSAREFAEVSTDPAAAPAASRDFSRTERLLLRVPVYAPNDAVPTVHATLMNRLGNPMRQLPLVPSSLPGGIVQFDLLLSSLAPDDYRVELDAASGGDEIKTLLLFRVTN